MAYRLLISVAHPDDESFGFGGLVAYYVDKGVDVYLICSTDGSAGVIDPEMMNGYKSPAELRFAELDCATEKLGFTKVYKFDYKDSGMMGSDTIDDPDCLWHVHKNRPEEVVRKITEVIREVKPHVVITFNKYGGYGHPDHIAMQRGTKEAFEKAPDPHYITDGLSPYRPQKLYYNRFPTIMIRLGIMMLRLYRKDPRKVGKNKDIDLVEVVANVEPAHAKINLKGYEDDWADANSCHISQGGGAGGGGIIPRWLRRLFGSNYSLTRVYPSPKRDRIDENDIFAGVMVNEAALDDGEYCYQE